MSTRDPRDQEPTQPVHRPSHPTTPSRQDTFPPEPEDVDELLSESLRAQSEEDFTWKEPERRPRWFERAERQQARSAATDQAEMSSTGPAGAASPQARSGALGRTKRGPRPGQMVWGAICLVLALWVLSTVVLGVSVEPVVVGLGICTIAGLTLVVAGLRPAPGTRL